MRRLAKRVAMIVVAAWLVLTMGGVGQSFGQMLPAGSNAWVTSVDPQSGSLPVYAESSSSSIMVGSLNQCTRVTLTGNESQGFAEISLPLSGWVQANMVSLNSSACSPRPSQSTSSTGTSGGSHASSGDSGGEVYDPSGGWGPGGWGPPGHWVPGHWVPGHHVPGHWEGGHWVPGHWVPGHHVPGHWVWGHPHPHPVALLNQKQAQKPGDKGQHKLHKAGNKGQHKFHKSGMKGQEKKGKKVVSKSGHKSHNANNKGGHQKGGSGFKSSHARSGSTMKSAGSHGGGMNRR